MPICSIINSDISALLLIEAITNELTGAAIPEAELNGFRIQTSIEKIILKSRVRKLLDDKLDEERLQKILK